MSVNKTIFINPNFKKTSSTHINPNFLIQTNASETTSNINTIHINPAFLSKFNEINKVTPTVTSTCLKNGDKNEKQAKILSKSRTKIIRESSSFSLSLSTNMTDFNKNFSNNSKNNKVVTKKPVLMKIGTKKLIRITNLSKSTQNSIYKTKKLNNNEKSSLIIKGKYKLERNRLKSSFKKNLFVSKYVIKRVTKKENLQKTKMNAIKNPLEINGATKLSCNNTALRVVNKKFEMININGVFYKSTKNKLQKTGTNSKPLKTIEKTKNIGKRSIYLRGNKFVSDKSGLSLIRVPNENNDYPKLKRIDIGGLTYIAKTKNLFIRSNIHQSRNYLSLARQKSINLLSKNIKKSNTPCQIYKILGKCAAFESNRCLKLHDKNQVNICSKFLRGECTNNNCLLSHEVTLSKMPTCKFFLQGCCVRGDCPYLHKKLNEKTEICLDFLRGFCHLAEKCNKRHEYLCPDFENSGKCEKSKCPYCRKKEKNNTNKQTNTLQLQESITKFQISNSKHECSEDEEKNQEIRYFEKQIIGSLSNVSTSSENLKNKVIELNITKTSEDFEDKSILKRRPKLGELPSFIPL